MFFICLFIVGFVSGRAAGVWASRLVVPEIPTGLRSCRACRSSTTFRTQLCTWFVPARCSVCSKRLDWWPVFVSMGVAALFPAFAWLLNECGCQAVSEVRPSQSLLENRLPYHLLFLFLMATATITDFLDYVIPDAIVLPGALAGLICATCSGELQLIHLWVDWDYELVAIYGPWIPGWLDQYQHLHGFVWSLAGALTGAGFMWAARIAAHQILGVPAIGFGDVTLMLMIGAFMGWQPTLCVIAVAPLVGLVLGMGGRLITGRSFVAFGPYLCGAAFIVLCCWSWLWEGLQLKIIFSHWPTITGMVSGAFAAFCILLVGLRVFRAVPAHRLQS